MAIIKCDSIEIEAPDELASVITGVIEKRDNTIADKDTKLAEITKLHQDSLTLIEKLEASSEASKVKLDSLTQENSQLKEQANNAVNPESIKARRKLERSAASMLNQDANFNVDSLDDMSDREIKELVVSKKLANLEAVKKGTLNQTSDIKLDSYYEIATDESMFAPQDSTQPLKEVLNNVIHIDSTDPSEQAALDSAKYAETAYLQTLKRG